MMLEKIKKLGTEFHEEVELLRSWFDRRIITKEQYSKLYDFLYTEYSYMLPQSPDGIPIITIDEVEDIVKAKC